MGGLKPSNELIQDSGLEDFLKAFADFLLANATGIVVKDRCMSYPLAKEPINAELEITILAGEGFLWAQGIQRSAVPPEELAIWRQLAESFISQERRHRQNIAVPQRINDLSAELELLNEPTELARAGLTALLELTGVDAGALYTLAGEQLHLQLMVGSYPNGFLQIEQGGGLHEKPGVVETALQSGKTVYVPDYWHWPGAQDGYLSSGARTLLASPLVRGHSPYGVLMLMNFAQPVQIPVEIQQVQETVARRINRALERSWYLKTLEKAREQTIRTLALGLEVRDLDTKGHTDRVTLLALQLGQKLNLPPRELSSLQIGSYLHDIGKIAIPDTILLKPGPLTESEKEVMQTHVQYGENMLLQMGFFEPEVRELVRHHHERWDGSGYPDGLAGEHIPLSARIFALADVYDALVSERPYKKAWSADEAKAEIQSQAGAHFDPELTRLFLELLG